MSRKFWLFLYSTPNVVGSVLALAGLALFFSGIIKQYWLAIVLGLYTLGFVATPRRREIDLRIQYEDRTEELRAALDKLVNTIRGDVPAEVLRCTESIQASILEVLPRLREMDKGDPHVHVIRETCLEYLPEMLQTYLKLPAAFARLHTVRDGKTPREILLEQLQLLDREMKAITVDIHQNDTQALLAHGRFLQKKFARGGDHWLE